MVTPDQDIITIPEGATLPEGVHLGTIKILGPQDMVERATSIATQLKKIIDDKQLFIQIRNKRHTFVEGWTTMLSMIGVSPQEVDDMQYPNGDWKVTVGLYTYAGQCVGRASAICGMDEKDKNGDPTWADKPSYARRSMAATRATGKAARLSFSWIMILAGYAATPAEEMNFLGSGESLPQQEENKASPGEFRVSLKKVKDKFGVPFLTMAELFEKDPEYVGWIAEKITDKPVGDMARLFLKDHPLPAKADQITEALSHEKVSELARNLRKAMDSGSHMETSTFWTFQRATGFDHAFANDIRLKHTSNKVTDWNKAMHEMFLEWDKYMDREGEPHFTFSPSEEPQ